MPEPTPGADNGHEQRGLFQRRYREVTIAAIVFGVICGGIMNAAITYAGLKIGFTIVGSAIAAVLGFGVLRGVLRKGSILETNIGQTIASAVNSPCSGVIFTVPVLLLLGHSLTVQSEDFWLLTVACIAGAVLGCAFIIPLRKQMIDIERLRFPSATAVGAILKSPGAGAAKAVALVVGVVLSALIALPAQLPQIGWPASVDKLDRLVEKERITAGEALLTRQIASWVEAKIAPPAIVEHGRLALELVAKKEALPSAPDSERPARRREIKELEQRIAHAHDAGHIAVQSALDSPAQRSVVARYPLELAKRSHLASTGAGEWSDLRARSTGWALDRPFGYSDLQWRMRADPVGDAVSADFAATGFGSSDPVLTVRSDRDRNGRPDLLLLDDRVDVGRAFGLPDEMQLVFAIAPFALGAGYLTGKAGLFVLAGGVLAYLIINPILFGLGWMPATVRADQAAAFGYGNINRPLGIGLLLGGAMMGVVASLPAIKEAFKSIAGAGKSNRSGRDELGLKPLLVAVVAALVLLFVAADRTASEPINTVCPVTNERIESFEHSTTFNGYTIAFATDEALDAFEAATPDQKQGVARSMNADRAGILAGMPTHFRAAIIAVIGALWIWFAGIIIAQCTGMTDWSPISGMALLTVVLVMVLAGPGGVMGAVLIGAALCVAITVASDMMADLKTGFIVGAQPRRQQIVEMITAGIGPLISMAVLLLIVAGNQQKFGVPIGPGTDTTAPQAQALQAIITGVQGGDMPYALYGTGAVLGGLLGLGAFSGLGVLVGLSMYLPMIYISTYGVGCIINMIVSKAKGPRWAEEWGVPVAAGFIVGDALLSLGVNLVVLSGG